MKQSVKWILLLLALAALLVGAWFAYRALSSDYRPAAAQDTESALQADTQSTEAAPDFAVLDKDGNTVHLSDFTGKPVVLNFWASWCGPCCSELPGFDRAYADWKDDVHFLMVNLTDGERETVAGVKAFLAENGYSFPVYYDTSSEGAIAYGVYSIPLTVFVRADGTVYNTQVGAMEESALRTQLEALLNG